MSMYDAKYEVNTASSWSAVLPACWKSFTQGLPTASEPKSRARCCMLAESSKLSQDLDLRTQFLKSWIISRTCTAQAFDVDCLVNDGGKRQLKAAELFPRRSWLRCCNCRVVASLGIGRSQKFRGRLTTCFSNWCQPISRLVLKSKGSIARDANVPPGGCFGPYFLWPEVF